MNARYYDPKRGQFLSQDPVFLEVGFNLSDPQSMNPYAYARNNPLRFTDPNGESFKDYVNNIGGYGIGLIQGGWQFARGAVGLAYNTLTDPVQTFNNGVSSLDSAAGLISYAVQDPSGAGNAISEGFTNSYNKFESKSAFEQGNSVGNIIGQIEAGLVAGVAVSKVAQVFKSENVFSKAADHAINQGHYPGLSKSEISNIAKSARANPDVKINIAGPNAKQYYFDAKGNNLFINNPKNPTVFQPTNGLDYLRGAVKQDIKRGNTLKK